MTTYPDQTRTDLLQLSPEAQDLLFRKARTANTFTDDPVSDEQVAATNSFRQLKPTHDRMLAAYRAQDWDGAAAAVNECAGIAPESLRGFYEVYAARIPQEQGR